MMRSAPLSHVVAPPGLFAILLIAHLAGCSSGSGDGVAVPDGTIYFGPLSNEPVAFTLSGKVRYEDRIYGIVSQSPTAYGFTAESRLNPVRYAVVDVVDENGFVIQTTATDAQGNYALSATAAGLLRLRVLARTATTSGIEVRIENAREETYAVSRYFVPGQGSFTLDSEIQFEEMAGAYNILDLYTAAAEFVRAREGQYPPALHATWEPGSNDGTYFDTSDTSIHVLGGTALGEGDTDEYDDDVLLHEYGHFIETAYGKIDSRGGEHHLADNTQDLRLAWSEGWSSFIAGTIKKSLRESGATLLSDNSGIDALYLDTIDSHAAIQWVFDANYAANDLSNSYASCETAVAKILWNVNRQSGFQDIWSTYQSIPSNRTRPVSLETFWDRWLAEGRATPYAAFAERNVIYAADANEPGDSVALSAPDIPLNSPTPLHTLYSLNDGDYYKINLAAHVSYAIETFGLVNGADTLLGIYPSGSLLPTAANDNVRAVPSGATDSLAINDGCTLASRIVFTPAVAGLYTIRVSSADSPSLAAGRYGSYQLKVAQAPVSYQCP